ncbi:hypothetical protein EXIGLDRAFT_847631 [Exidia glandulosa HHB12029]|uniref:Uncharacterized protein n=1 Tax=Exidia glandulosa HHB12029 TaxID=1314781 RepID=A0A166MRH7_EXIGL|nr:hypothetical protein EXIGLDRAFT_847631 [Exidia glandulosa HHB12029]
MIEDEQPVKGIPFPTLPPLVTAADPSIDRQPIDHRLSVLDTSPHLMHYARLVPPA